MIYDWHQFEERNKIYTLHFEETKNKIIIYFLFIVFGNEYARDMCVRLTCSVVFVAVRCERNSLCFFFIFIPIYSVDVPRQSQRNYKRLSAIVTLTMCSNLPATCSKCNFDIYLTVSLGTVLQHRTFAVPDVATATKKYTI